MVLGVLVGMLPIPLPGGHIIRLGLAGGPLLVALFLGTRERTGGITWVMPISANLTLRQIGVLLFLAGVGTRAGYDCLHTLQTSGVQLILAGAIVTFTVTLASMLLGHYAFRIPFDALMGLMSGIQTQAAAVAFANQKTRSDAPNVGYAAVYPAAMVTKIVIAQIFASWPLAK
jgi:putative transport protein